MRLQLILKPLALPEFIFMRFRTVAILTNLAFVVENLLYGAIASPILASAPIAQQFAQANTISRSFNDVQGHWAESFIEALHTRGLIQGFPDGNFRPDAPLTRADFAAMIQSSFQNSRFPLGIVRGDPDQYITRAQALVLLVEGLNLSVQSVSANTLDNYFQDAAQILKSDRDRIAAAVENRLIVNYPDVRVLNPNRIATRAEITAFIYQALVKNGDLSPGGAGNNPASNSTSSLSTSQLPPQVINNQPALTSAIAAQNEEYTLGAGDRIRFDIVNVPEYSGEYQILVNGTLNLPLIGGVSVAGMTLRQAGSVIASLYSRTIRNPQLTVSLLTPRPVQIAIAGEVNRPGSYNISLTGTSDKGGGQLPTLTQAIKTAGGITQAANLRQVFVRRPQKFHQEQVIAVDLWALIKDGDLRQDLTLRDGDSIFIPTANDPNLAEASQLAAASFAADKTQPLSIAVVGEVAHPGSYVVKPNETGERPTLTQALQTAGGVTQAGDIHLIQVHRPTKNGSEQIINVDLWQLFKAGDLRQNLILEQGDTIFIPTANEVNIAQANQLAATNIAADKTQSLNVAVVGEVARPGPYTVKPDDKGGLPTLTKAIQTAGGITQLADIRQIEVHRPTRTGTEQVFSLNLWQLLQAGDLRQYLALQEGDTIVIPTATALNPQEVAQLATASFSPNSIKVNVVGEVNKVGTVEVPPNTPLNQALLAAGGFTNRAKKGVVDLIRLNPDGTVSKRNINIDFAQGISDRNNPVLRNNDVVVVNRSSAAQITDSLGAILNPLASIFSISSFFKIF